jgi:undecaprenyl-diphosphatase
MNGKVTGATVLEFIAARDHRLMTRVNGWRPPRWFRLWMIFSTRGGDGWLWYAIGILVALYGGAHRWEAVLASALAVTSGVGLFIALKRTIRRKRPCALGPHCWAELLPPDQFSFPSGHTITAFAMMASLGCFYPVLLAPLGFCALSIAVSRVILGMHFASDVAAGAGLGLTLGYQAASLFV